MAFVQHIALSNTVRFAEDSYLFEYRDVRFKLVQNDPSKHADVLLTILPGRDEKAQDHAFAVAGEFVSALAWSIGLPMAVEPAGGMPEGVATIEAARCACFGSPQFFTMGNIRGHSISSIAQIETDEQRRALALFREADSANKTIMSFLLYWQVMDIPPQGWPATNPSAWVDDEDSAGRIFLRDDQRDLLDRLRRGRSLGKYLSDDCRNAIAHLRRSARQRVVLFDDREDLRRFRVSSDVAKDLARQYIRAKLGLSKRMTLLREGKDGFPVYIKAGGTPIGYVLAYSRG
jgi:hypothetical protein